ncbi:MAG: sigma-54 dependent transcriptional regulator [candidate division FCPU426 bacterium]
MSQSAAATILIVDDEPEICWIVKKALSEEGYDVSTAFTGEQGLETAGSQRPDLIFLDLKLPGMDGLEVLRQLKDRQRDQPVVILSAFDDLNAAVRAMKFGAYDYLSKPLNLDELRITVKNALQTSRLQKEVTLLKGQIAQRQSPELVWSCPAMQQVVETVERIAPYDVTVLIRGESGTGKEVVAAHLHAKSPRADKPLVSIDCSALPQNLMESELFGFERGAFTGAQDSKPGRFEMAQGGTLFLDEIGNLPQAMQIKLLRVLQERRLRRLGGKHEVDIDVRVVAATNSSLEEAMAAGNFREDLYHRLNEFTVVLPPLRARGDEIDLLAQHFLALFNRQFNKSVTGFSPEVLAFFHDYAWPGNVRELMNAVKRALVMAERTIELAHLPTDRFDAPRPEQSAAATTAAVRPLKEVCQEVARRVERETISRALQETRWNKVKTAKLLKINYKTLFNKMRELGI